METLMAKVNWGLSAVTIGHSYSSWCHSCFEVAMPPLTHSLLSLCVPSLVFNVHLFLPPCKPSDPTKLGYGHPSFLAIVLVGGSWFTIQLPFKPENINESHIETSRPGLSTCSVSVPWWRKVSFSSGFSRKSSFSWLKRCVVVDIWGNCSYVVNQEAETVTRSHGTYNF